MSESKISPVVLDNVPMAGDVALVLGSSPGSKLLVWLQRMIGRRTAVFSHAMLSLGGNLWCQAMPGKGRGVEIVTTEEAFLAEDAAPEKMQLWRPPSPAVPEVNADIGVLPPAVRAMLEVELAAGIYRKWLYATMYFYGQRYNFKFLLPKLFGDTTKFCSELVVAVMRALRISPFAAKRPYFFTPADFQFDREIPAGWSDQTQMLRRYLETERRHEFRAEGQQQAGILRDSMKRLFVFAADANTRVAQAAVSNLRVKSSLPSLKNGLPEAIGFAEKALAILAGLDNMRASAPWAGGGERAKEARGIARRLRRAIAKAKSGLSQN